MVFPIVRIDAVGSNDHLPVSLVSINRRHPNAGVRVNSSENKRVGIHSVENLVKVCFKKGAVPFLDDIGLEEAIAKSEEILQPSVSLIVIRIPFRFISGNASRRSDSNSWRTQMIE